MKFSKKATSIIETMVIIVIVVTGVTGVWGIYNESQKLSQSVWYKTQAIQIAREWIEAMTNIRDTNWLMFPSDTPNCWNVLNYSGSCIGNVGVSSDIGTGSYIIYPHKDNNRWMLETRASLPPASASYREEYRVMRDATTSLYTQSWSFKTELTEEIKPLFTREIVVEYIDENADSVANSQDEEMLIKSIVHWNDASGLKKIELESILTNWR